MKLAVVDFPDPGIPSMRINFDFMIQYRFANNIGLLSHAKYQLNDPYYRNQGMDS
jgi:hypothetical protein